MSKFVKAWRKHLHESIDDETLRRNVLNEITEDEYEYIKNWMRNAPEEAYSFNNLFGGKKRIAITPPPPPAVGAGPSDAPPPPPADVIVEKIEFDPLPP